MKYTTIPNSDIKVSKICLGTMTWGQQNTEAEGHQQMDYALEKGVNFFDVAELYPIPARAETYGATEKIIGSWFQKTGNREKVVLATKIAGWGAYTAHIRKDGFSKRAIKEAVENSLKRLQTDYIDLYQSLNKSSSTKFGIVTFNLGSTSIALLMAKIAPSLRAQFLLEIPLFTSQCNIIFNLLSASEEPSRSIPKPPLITSPHPTPPPLWIETHVAPLKLSPITF